MVSKVHSGIALVGLALALGACGRSVSGRGMELSPGQSPDVTLHVKNQNFLDATLYAIWRSGRRDRLGTVSGNTERDFTFRWEANDLQIEIHLLSVEGSYRTQMMAVERGDELDLVVEPGLDRRIRIRRP